MKFVSTVAASLALASTAFAAATKPFYLVLESKNATLNGKTLEAGHEGAAIEGLLLGSNLAGAQKKPAYNTYRFNYTRETPNYGYLTFTLPGTDGYYESEAMQFFLQPGTNVAIALFEPTEQYQFLSFDSKNQMYIQNYYDDTVTPPKVLDKSQDLYKWNMCEYNYSGYIYNVLCWSYGVAKPQNPSCQAVNVTRVYA